jgi:maltose alpha-D-glucosyltransferase/alpha-amylase
VGDRPYFLNLGPFAFYWFALEKVSREAALSEDVPMLDARGKWAEVFADQSLGRAIARYVQSRRWFGGKTRTIANVTVRDYVPLAFHVLALLTIEYTDAEPDTYLLPLGITQARRADEKVAMPIAQLKDGSMLYEPVGDEGFAHELLETIARRRHLKGGEGALKGVPSRALRELRGGITLEAHVIRAEQSNTAIVYGQRLFLKLFRRLDPGENVDLEVSRFLNEETEFHNTPQFAGTLEYRMNHSEPMTLAIVQGFVENAGDAWRFTLDAIGRYFERVTTERELAPEMIGRYLADAELLGRRTAEMHLALASRDDVPGFVPEPFTPHYQRSIYQSIRTQIVQTLQLLRRRAKENPDAQELLKHEAELQQRIRGILDIKIGGQRIRTHGDYHLGQVLYTGNDFVIIDFEGEPQRPLSERRIKRSALRDVAGMLRSFHYAPYAVFFGRVAGSVTRPEDAALLETGAIFWHQRVSEAFLRAYLERSAGARHLPPTLEEVHALLDAHLLEKALYEIAYELNNRPEWVHIPLRGILDLLR